MSVFDLKAISEPLTTQTGLAHAILQSLLNYSKAQANDRFDGKNKQGWWAEGMVSGIGCRDWTLSREKQTEDTRKRALRYTEQSLEWLVKDNHLKSIDVTAYYQDDRLIREIIPTLPDGTKLEPVVL
ncbi:MAG: hypothetical protein DSZ27_07320 [Thiomicrospira sp.]|nr:MAG: hypothetical protein DSZ27_07320 [Thiomicrospira sp.]